MDLFWTKSYPPGMPRAINVKQYKHIADMLSHCCDQYKKRIAFSGFGDEVTYGEYHRKAKQLATAWQQLGLKKEDRIAILMPNSLQYPIALFAAFLAGLVVVNLNPASTPDELAHQMEESESKALLVMDVFLPGLMLAMPTLPLKYIITTRLGDCVSGFRSVWMNVVGWCKRSSFRKMPSQCKERHHVWSDLLKQGARHTFRNVVIRADDLAFIQYTPGLDGPPKGVLLTHQNVVANVIQATTWIKPIFDLEQRGTGIIVLPFHHMAAITLSCFSSVIFGMRSVVFSLEDNIRDLVRFLQKEPITLMVGMNTLFNDLLSDPEFPYANFSQLKCVLSAGMPLQWSVADRWRRVTGVSIVESYGLAEASPVVAINPVNRHSGQFNSGVGLPLPNTIVKIVNERGMPLPAERTGEICVKGPQVTILGYCKNPDKSTCLLDPNGWLRTGDMGHMDEQGFLYFLGRKKDMILISGFQVYPSEIEELLVSHPAVSEAAVSHVQDEVSVSHIVAVVVPRTGRKVSEEQLIELCRKTLPAYKVPQSVVVVSSLPRTRVGKLRRRGIDIHL